MKTDEYARMIEHSKIRRINRRSVWQLVQIALILAITVIVLTAMVKATIEFEDRSDAILTQQADMLARCDAMESQLIKVSEAVENWGGLK